MVGADVEKSYLVFDRVVVTKISFSAQHPARE